MSKPFRQAVVVSCVYTAFFALLGQALPLPLLRGEWLHARPPGPLASSSATPAPAPSATVAALHTGQAFPPLQDSPDKLARCKDNLAVLGTSASKLAKVGSYKDIADGNRGKDVCPTSGLRYRWIPGGDRYALYCSGRPHGDVAVHWDSGTQAVGERWAEFQNTTTDPERMQLLLLRFGAAQWEEDWAQCLDLVGEMKRIEPGNEWVLGREADCNLYAGNLEDATAMSQSALAKFPDSADLLNVRSNVLLADDECEEAEQLARRWRQKDPGNENATISLVIALAHLDKWEDAEKLSSEVRDPLFRTYWDLAYKRYAASSENAQRCAREQGWDLPYTAHALLTGVLAGPLGGEPEKRSRERLLQAYETVPKAWPYPCFRYLNGDISESELLAAAGDIPSWETEAKYTIALNLLAQRQQADRAKQLLMEISEDRFYYEAMVAASLLR